MNHFAKVCHASKEKVHVAVEAEGYGYESEESLLKIVEITAINGSGKKLTASITFLQRAASVSIGHWCNLQRYQSQQFSSVVAKW